MLDIPPCMTDRIIGFHRGNTAYGFQNSLEALVGSSIGLKPHTDIDNDMEDTLTSLYPVSQQVYEIDILLSSPYLIIHDVNSQVCDNFKLTKHAEEHLNTNDKDTLLNSYVHSLTKDEIKHLLYKTGDTPMLLEDALLCAKELNLKLYLDIKVPKEIECTYSTIRKGVNDILYLISNTDTIQNVDVLISFNHTVELCLRSEIDQRDLNVDLGMFVSDEIKDDYLNRMRLTILNQIVKPTVLSFKYSMLLKDHFHLINYDSPNIRRKYVWTFHVDDLQNNSNKLELIEYFDTHNVCMVIDTFKK
jgi:hypothetical protein